MTCEHCQHWHKRPANLQNLTEIRGECRVHPPQQTVLAAFRGTQMQVVGQVAMYPVLAPDTNACSLFLQVPLLSTPKTLEVQ